MILSNISRTRRAFHSEQEMVGLSSSSRLANLGAKTTKTRLHRNLSGGPCAAGLGAPDACQCLPLWPITCAQSAIATLDRLDSATLSLAALSALSAQLVGGSCTLPGLQLDHSLQWPRLGAGTASSGPNRLSPGRPPLQSVLPPFTNPSIFVFVFSGLWATCRRPTVSRSPSTASISIPS